MLKSLKWYFQNIKKSVHSSLGRGHIIEQDQDGQYNNIHIFLYFRNKIFFKRKRKSIHILILKGRKGEGKINIFQWNILELLKEKIAAFSKVLGEYVDYSIFFAEEFLSQEEKVDIVYQI